VCAFSIVVEQMLNFLASLLFAWKQDVAKSNWPKSKHSHQFKKSNTCDQCDILMCANNTNKMSINVSLGMLFGEKETWRLHFKNSSFQARLFNKSRSSNQSSNPRLAFYNKHGLSLEIPNNNDGMVELETCWILGHT
jgi:hypothetical protein